MPFYSFLSTTLLLRIVRTLLNKCLKFKLTLICCVCTYGTEQLENFLQWSSKIKASWNNLYTNNNVVSQVCIIQQFCNNIFYFYEEKITFYDSWILLCLHCFHEKKYTPNGRNKSIQSYSYRNALRSAHITNFMLMTTTFKINIILYHNMQHIKNV